MARNKDFFVNSAPKRDKSFFVKEDTKKTTNLPTQQKINTKTIVGKDKFNSQLQAPVKQDLGDKVGNFFKVTIPNAAEDLWDDIKEPFVGKSTKQIMTEAKLSPKMLVEDAKVQMEKENPTREDYALVKQTQDAIKKYGTPESNIRAISEDTTKLQEQLKVAEKTWQASPVDAAAANTGAAAVSIFGNMASFANSLGADKIPLLKEVTNFAVDGARRAQQNAQQYNKGNYGEALGAVTQGVVNLVPYFLIGTGTTAVKGATTVSKYGKYIEPIIKNPSFWYSLTSMWGQKYQEKLDEGYNRFDALKNAIMYALPASLIEVSGGFGAKGKEAQSLLITMGEEIAEEITQDIMSGISDKATTNHDLPIFSMTEDAIINPKQLGKTALYTAPIVAFGGGANNVINKSINNRVENQKAQAQINQDLQNLRKQSPQNVNSVIQLENAKGLPENSLRKLIESQNNKQGNVIAPNQAKITQNTNMEQIAQVPNLPTQKAQKTLQSAKNAGMTDMDMQKAIDLNNMLRSGANLEFYDAKNIPENVQADKAKIANGFYKDGTLWINKNSKNAVEQILGHELTHHLETTNSYNDLSNTILDSEMFYDFIAEKGYTNVAEYKTKLKEMGYTDAQMNNEMVARFVEEKMFTDQASIDRLARQNTKLVEKIKNWISDLVVSFKGTAQEKELRRIENMYRKALEQARNSTNAQTLAYSIKEDANGKFVKVDTDQDIFEGINEKDYNKIAKMYMQDYLKGTTKLTSNDETIIDTRGIRKYTNPQQRTAYFDEKMFLTPELKNVLEIAEKVEVSEANKDNSKYDNWEYYKFNFEIGDRTFEGLINIGIDKNGYKHFYEINKIHPIGISSVSTNSTNRMYSNNSINQNDSSVNTEYAQENKKDTAGKEPAFSIPETDNQGRTLSKEQQEFFKDSKVRDDNGKLLEVYHGTENKFNIYKSEYNEFFFTDSEIASRDYGSVSKKQYLNLINPYEVDYAGGYDKRILDDIDYAKANGYDGVIARNTYDGANTHTQYVAFEPNQIKNVDNTNPTSNPDIRYSMNPVEVAKNPKAQESNLLNEIAPIDEKQLENVEEKEITASILTKSPKRPAKDLLKQSVDVVMRKLVDAGNTINTVGKLTGDKHLYEYFNNTKQARQSAEYMIGEAQTDIKGNRVGNSLIRIFEEVRSKGDAYTNEFFEYLLHMHNIDRMAQNKPVFGASVTAEDSRRVANQLLEKHPEFEKQANKVYAYNRNLMQWRVDSGLISKEQADLMNEMYPHYVPTFRDVSGTSGSRAMQGTVQIANTIRKATGSNKDIMPIDASMARQTMQTVQAAKRNLLGNRLLNDALNNKDKVGEYIQAVEKTTEQNDLETELDTPKDTNLDSNNNVFKIFRNGETYVMQVNNGIYEGLKSISSEIDNTDTRLLLKPVKAANNMFKKLITGYSPMFTIRNFARDIQDAGLYSKNLRSFLKKYPEAYQEMMGNGKMWQLYKSLGGTGSSFFDYETGIEKTLDTQNKTSTKIKDATLGKVEELNMMIEQAPRFAEFMATIEKAGNKNYDTLMEAMLNAADVTVNFGRSGTVVKEWNSTFVPFLNPSIQGFDKLTRTVLESKDGKKFAKLAIRATLLGILPSVINELLYWDDEEYENLTDRDKDTNFLIKTGDNKWLKIPKGRVLSIFGNTAARGLRTLKGEKWDVGEYLKNQASQTAPISVFDSNLYSPIQAVQNNKTWYGSDIVPQRLQDYAPKDQYDENTDAFSKWLGGKINYSPKKINYLIDAYTGIIGDVALPLTTPKAETNPFTKAFVLDGVTSNEISNDFYNMLDKYNPKQNPKKSAKEVSRYLNKQSSQVSDIYKQIREVENSDISDDKKRKQVRELRELANTIELTAMATVPEYEKAVDKYRGTFADEDVDSDYAYLFANRDVFGAEYAVKTFSKSLYNNHKDENMNTFFRNYFTREYFQKKLEPKETKKTTNNTLPTLSSQRAKLPTLKK